MFKTGVKVFDMLVVVRVEDAKAREPWRCIENRVWKCANNARFG